MRVIIYDINLWQVVLVGPPFNFLELMNNLLLVINNSDLRKKISRSMLLAGYRVVEEDNFKSGLDKFKQISFDAIICELESKSLDEMSVIKQIKQVKSNTPLIGITNNGTRLDIAAAIYEGAYMVLHAPFDLDVLQIQIKKALEHYNLIQEVTYLRHACPNVVYNFDNIVGKSEKIRELFSVLQKIAQTKTSVLICGEFGTGKELVAGAIHYNSLRKENNFVKANCSGLTETHLESELFGHEAGAFEGANKQRIGRLEQANYGTVLLEEISNLTLSTQAKLLKLLQDREIQRMGGTQTIKLDLRIISSTNRNLQDEIRAGRFREDLYYRLNVVPIEIPPLRQRKEDIPVLAEYFLKYFNKELNKKVSDFEPYAIKMMTDYRWPGNVRELRNAVERGVLRTKREKISLKDMALPFTGAYDTTSIPMEELYLSEVEKNTIIKALDAADWVQKDAARLLGISKRALNYKIENFQIKNPKWIKNR